VECAPVTGAESEHHHKVRRAGYIPIKDWEAAGLPKDSVVDIVRRTSWPAWRFRTPIGRVSDYTAAEVQAAAADYLRGMLS
jgi:hypothetical protein